MSQYTKKSKNGRLRRSKQMKYSLNKKQEGGHNYTVTSSSSSTTRGNHLLSFLKEYDTESEISEPSFVDCYYYYKGIEEEDLSRIRNYLLFCLTLTGVVLVMHVQLDGSLPIFLLLLV